MSDENSRPVQTVLKRPISHDEVEDVKPREQLKPSLSDMVRSPAHYTNNLAKELGIEVIDIACALNLNGNRFSILRYVCRAGLKNAATEIEDLEKIKEYADFEIRRLKGEAISYTRRGER